MIASGQILFFAFACLILVISPGPNMLYLISRSITQGKKAGVISLAGVISGFLFHILMVSFGLTAILFAVPFAYNLLRILGVIYLVYLAFQAIRPGSRNIFDINQNIPHDNPRILFSMGFLTNVLNPKVAVFYLSLFPQFIRPEHGAVLTQSIALGIIQISISFSVNFLIVLSAASVASFFSRNPSWIKIQKWFMAGTLTFMAIKMAFSRR